MEGQMFSSASSRKLTVTSLCQETGAFLELWEHAGTWLAKHALVARYSCLNPV